MHSFDQNTINSYYYNMKNAKEVIRFLLIGGLATAIDFLLMSLFIFAVCFDDFGGSLWQVFVSGKNIADTWVVVVGTGIGFLGGLIFNYIFSCKIGEDTILVELINLPYPKKNRKAVRLLNKSNQNSNVDAQSDNNQNSTSNQYIYNRDYQNSYNQSQNSLNQYQVQKNNNDGNQTYDYL